MMSTAGSPHLVRIGTRLSEEQDAINKPATSTRLKTNISRIGTESWRVQMLTESRIKKIKRRVEFKR